MIPAFRRRNGWSFWFFLYMLRRCRLQTFATTSIVFYSLSLLTTHPFVNVPRERFTSTKKSIAFPQYSVEIARDKIATRNILFPKDVLRNKHLRNIDPLLESSSEERVDITEFPIANKSPSPRVVFIGASDLSLAKSFFTSQSSVQGHLEITAMERNFSYKEPYHFRKDFEKPFFEQCTPIIQQMEIRPTCTFLHEINLQTDIELLSTTGSWRTVWKVKHENVVLKLLSFNRAFDHETFDYHAVDALAMDQLTASSHVINPFGFCGQSTITEWAPTSGRDYIKQDEIRTRERLKIARDLARGLADVHALRPLFVYNGIQKGQKPPVTMFAHNDINIANTVQVNGVVKWNDFNIGVFLRHRNGTNCGAPVRFQASLWRSPEEIRNTSYVDLEKTDVYGLGNILYQVMTRHQPWTHKEPDGRLELTDIEERKKKGMLPTIPEQYVNNTRLEMRALISATMACYHPDPDKRPTAYELADALGKVYEWCMQNKRVSRSTVQSLFVK